MIAVPFVRSTVPWLATFGSKFHIHHVRQVRVQMLQDNRIISGFRQPLEIHRQHDWRELFHRQL